MTELLFWFESLPYYHFVFYWIGLLLLDIFFLEYYWRGHRFRLSRLNLNFWQPFGVFIPLFWLGIAPSPAVIDAAVIGFVIVFFGVLRPLLYQKHHGSSL